MKRTITTILLSTLLIVSYSQSTDSITNTTVDTITEPIIIESKLISKSVDEFTDEVDYFVEGMVFYADGGDLKTKGMIMQLFLKSKNEKLKAGTMYFKVAGMTGCIDKGSTLIVMFENGTKTTLTNFNSFSCKGVNYFSIAGKEDLFKNNKIKAFKYTNKRTYESMVVKNNMTDGNKTHLMNILLEIDKINSGEVTVGLTKE